MDSSAINVERPPSGDGCVECLATGGWWFHLRRCAFCGHVGCCDSSLGKHATKHYEESGHQVMQSYEPGEDWFWNFETEEAHAGPRLFAPTSHPEGQPVPGPAGSVPEDWEIRLN